LTTLGTVGANVPALRPDGLAGPELRDQGNYPDFDRMEFGVQLRQSMPEV